MREVLISIVVIFLGSFLVSIAITACFYFAEVKTDKNLQRQLFNECLSKIPREPNNTVTNDWSEVVNGCRRYSRELSKQ